MFSLKKAIQSILIVTFIISGLPWIAFISYAYLLRVRESDPKYEIVAIAQSTQNQESLKTAFLAELLELSVDRPLNIYKFNLKDAKRKLLDFPCIKDASLRRIPPGILSIDYVLRKPVAILGDYANTAIDEYFYAFPFYPFYSPKKLPLVTLGLDNLVWGERILDPKLHLAFQVLKIIHKWEPLQIDVSLADALSLGEQKIIVQFRHHDVLLNPRNFTEGLCRYKAWRKNAHGHKGLTMVDLRLPQLGFMSSK